jgi:CGNR zinc finger/Putative stress-induced transcription regulator
MTVNTSHRWEAPGRLEPVRTLLNTRLPGPDRLPELAADPARWAASFPGVPPPRRGQLARLTELRDGLRELLGEPDPAERARRLSERLGQARLGPVVEPTGGGLGLRLRHLGPPSPVGAVLEAVAEAVAGGAWDRLKQCPDCRLVFFDHTRNQSKVWCGMYAGPDGRACGTIAKVRRYRARRRARAGGGQD